ncbi:MAG: hypothetical protein MUP98_21580 [Candidatus Aminicenantes bacterium]|nr:hypothetical protein [Candidatus Aminicenantes bacterium]
MNQTQISEDIQLIRDMIEKTKEKTAESWKFFSIWGILIIAGIIGNYTLVYFKKFNAIWINWLVFMLVGVFISIFYISKKEKTSGATTYAQIAIGHLSFACGIAFMLAGFVFPMLKLYSYEEIPIFISMIVGILLFVIGGIYEWNLLKWSALLWWLGSVGMIFIHWHYRALACVPLIILGYLVPGFILRSQYKKESRIDES